MKKIELQTTSKQWETYLKLFDDTTEYILFGGGAGGGKSYLICQWIIYMAITYPKTKWFIGREELKRLMQSTYLTFIKCSNDMGIDRDSWKLDGKYNFIEFQNGSRVDLLDLKLIPSDPLFERFGSLEYTGGAIEEGGEVHFKAFDVLKSRVNRHMNKEYNIPPKTLITCNPKKNWLYYVFYKPSRDDSLPENYAFIEALYFDNPHTADSYKKSLSNISDKTLKERLMFGNWDYEQGDDTLIEYRRILELYTNNHVKDGTKKYIVCDVARFGKDKTTISLWNGLVLKKWYVFNKQSTVDTAKEIVRLADSVAVPRSHIIIDDGGVGGGVVDMIPGCTPFLGSRSALNVETNNFINYGNLRAQCAFMLADYVNTNQINILDEEFRGTIIEELEQLKKRDIDKENKIYLIEKEKIKYMIGRSPDFADNLCMRMLGEITNQEAFVIHDESGLVF